MYILENVKVGDVFTCNVAPKPSDINLLQPTEIWDKSELLAVIGWTGTKIPDLVCSRVLTQHLLNQQQVALKYRIPFPLDVNTDYIIFQIQIC